ncbi:MAG: 2-hydroxyacyl-CoA dehydratase [bacterium]|nr:2-hydroxyacyl-CoA dehydratase [bacterium]
MNQSLSVIEEFKRINSASPFNQTVAKWKESKKKVIGWLCSYVPEEIIHAAGALPVRMMGKQEIVTGESEAYLYSNSCSFVRNCLEMGLSGEYDFLDGIVTGTTCDHIRRFYEVWERYLNAPYKFLLSVPHKTNDHSLRFYVQELERFVEDFSKFCGTELTDQTLKESIDLYNHTRRMLKRIYKLRAGESPPITGTEMHEVMNACVRMPREEYNRLLERLLNETNSRAVDAKPSKSRFLISGSHLDSTHYIRDIEKMGGIVVADELCTGSNYFWDLTDDIAPPIEALAHRYLNHVPCARMRPSSKRLEHLLNLVATHHVDGIIFIKMKFCDLYAFDGFMFNDVLKKTGVPILELEREYHQCSSGQMQTRIQAFMEMIVVKKCSRT